MRIGFAVSVCAALTLVAGVGTASAGGGNSAAAKACKKGGWQNLRRADQTPFKNQGDCVSYAARGGTLTSPTITSRQVCESVGGSFAFIALPGVLWQCGYWPFANTTELLEKHAALTAQCLADDGSRLRTNIIDGRGVSICETT